MQFINALQALVLLAVTASAAPYDPKPTNIAMPVDPSEARLEVSPPVYDSDGKWYVLQTKVISGGDMKFDNLYVQSYHTGAGLSDATLGIADQAVLGYLNNTVQQFNITDGFPWSFAMPSSVTYDAWYPVRLNAGMYSTDFFINSTGLQWSPLESFGGWLVCDWSHGVPQLFWKVDYISYPLPNCAQVNLYPIVVVDTKAEVISTAISTYVTTTAMATYTSTEVSTTPVDEATATATA